MQWVVRANISAEGEVTYERLGENGQTAEALDISAGPAELLLASMAGCFVISCHMVLAAKSEALIAITATVTGIKAEDRPARIASMDIDYQMPDLADNEARLLARNAKKICTISNTLNCDIQLVEKA